MIDLTVEPISHHLATGIYRQCKAAEDGADLDTWEAKSGPETIHLGSFFDGLLVGVTTFEFITGACANAHVAYLPIAYGRISKECGRLALQYIWDNTMAEVVMGMTPENYRLALRYLKDLGFEPSGEIPQAYRHGGKAVSMILNHIKRGA